MEASSLEEQLGQRREGPLTASEIRVARLAGFEDTVEILAAMVGAQVRVLGRFAVRSPVE